MSIMLVGECSDSHLFKLTDADAISESEFEYMVVKALICIYKNYKCFKFSGGFNLDGNISRPDIALVANDYSHWFIIEVELLSHSLEYHVFPQIRAFRYGEPTEDCIKSLSENTGRSLEQIKTFLAVVPRSVAVIANKYERDWDTALRFHEIQFLNVAVYRSPKGETAIEISRPLVAKKEHLGFGYFSATDRALRFHRTVKLPEGEIQIEGIDDGVGLWTVTRDDSHTWVTKNIGTPSLRDSSSVQLIRTFDGRISIKREMGK